MRGATRREFLRRLSAVSTVGAAGAPLALNLAAMTSASAQSVSGGYKALVCIFLNGGNDAYNTVLSTQADDWAAYKKARDPSGLSATPESLLNQPPVLMRPDDGDANPDAPLGSPANLGPTLAVDENFAMHPLLLSTALLYGAYQRLAVVANVGPLVEPISNYAALAKAKVPSKLFSHNDQASTWQSFGQEGTVRGWGGKLADLLLSQNGTNSAFTAISPSGNAVWLAGQSVLPYQVAADGPASLTGGDHVFGQNASIRAASLRIMNGSYRSSSNLLEKDLATVGRRSAANAELLSNALGALDTGIYGDSSALTYYNPLTLTAKPSGLSQQLQTVARLIKAGRDTLGLKRQVFFVRVDGFDTHDDQNRRHADLMSRLDAGLMYFDSVIGQLGMSDEVTTFTASDFGRSLASNGDGTDHGWGGHHFVMGGAVNGGSVYGKFPKYGLLTNDGLPVDSTGVQIAGGALLPQVSVDEFAAKLGVWMGASLSDMATVCPNLSKFSARTDLNFMKA